jgi:hypothetical protein
MPCQSDYSPSYEELQRERQMRDTETRLACDRCRELEARGGVVPELARGWWEKHKAEDAARLAAEIRAKRDAEVRAKAISKLTPEERAELGV